ncbi:hypothetical protein, conserved [Babesia bigemina]|uniref:C3H1-type domain-containing protein n=1 Tax=Babesia bigemina TaxID=5866 RepID=A0A061BIQ8_BABBI|nr:hypothetical protein, conserved [Babesia bigemina]CDR71369.1 hypothetical protein, conserved [Babesia bigemina]|eukprot:XP_012770319.1 hypothetical protein, conserved [Babesia bigemina]
MKIVEKLKKFATELGENDNILTHLCDGLEKFLGFNSESKGYTGQGIVYSDLDRLCDGVMGFLSGVLEAVKNENEVTTYDVNRENKLSKVLTTLNDNIGKGSKGLETALGDVTWWLGDYEIDLIKKTERVTEYLGKFVHDLGDKHFISVSGKDSRPLVEQLHAWKTTVYQIDKDINNAETNYINVLDSTLKSKIKCETHMISEAVKMFNKSAWDEVFEGQVKQVDEIIRDEQTKLLTVVGNQVYQLEDRLDREFTKIDSKIVDLEMTKKSEFIDFERVLKEARRFLYEDFDKDYTNNIAFKFTEIIRAVEKLHGDLFVKKAELEGLVSEMQGTLKMLSDNFETDVKAGVRGNLSEMKTSINEIKSHINDSTNNGRGLLGALLKDIENVQSEVVKKVSLIEEKSKSLDSKYSGDSEKFHEQFINLTSSVADLHTSGISSGLRTWVHRVGGQLKELEKIHETVHGEVMQSLSQVTTALSEQIVSLKRQINEKLVAYVNKLANADDSDLNEWEQVFTDAKVYPGRNNIRDMKAAIKKDSTRIAGQLNAQVEQANEDINSFATAAAKEGTNKFKETLDNKINKHSNNGVSGGICGLIKKEFDKLIGPFNDSEVHPFRRAFRDFDKQLKKLKKQSSATLEIESEIKSLVGYLGSAVTNLEQDIEKFGSTAAAHTKNSARIAIGEAASKIAAEIEMFEENHADAFVGTQLGAKVQELRKHITKLETYVTNDGKGAIDSNIKEIHTKVLDSLGNLIRENDGVSGGEQSDLINKKRVETHKKMEALKNEMKDKLYAMELETAEASDKLAAVIKRVQMSLQKAHKSSTDAVIKIKNEITDAVTKAFQIITEEVQKLFARQKTADLLALKDLVNRQLRTVKRIIKKDLESGNKGFLKTLADSVTKSSIGNKAHIKFLEAPDTRTNVHTASDAFRKCYWGIEAYLKKEITRLHNDNTSSTNPVNADESSYTNRFTGVGGALTTLLEHISEQNKYDHRVPSMLSDLRAAVTALKPDGFSTPNAATLDCITSGLTKFADELDKAYVSVYDGHPDPIDFSQLIVTKPAPVPKEPKQKVDNSQPSQDVLTAEGEKLCKVFFTLLEILLYDFTYLKEECGERWKTEKLCQNDGGRENPLGIYLQRCGYEVAQNESSKDGELRCHEEMKGEKIHNTFIVGAYPALFDTDKDATRAFQTLADCLNLYYQVCHYSTLFSKKHPSSVYQMLTWFSGLPHSPVYDDLSLNGFGGLFKKPEHDDSEEPTISFGDVSYESHDAYPAPITATGLSQTLTEVCTNAHSTLTAILGHGHAGGTYAVDYNTNAAGLAYPANPSQCLDLLVELALRLYHQLCFLHVQCSRKDYAVSWRDCYYGRYVAGSDWRCNDKQCVNQMGNQIADQKANQTCGQTCEQHPKCGLKSPLQSFLEDGLAGFIPHPYSKANCKLSCDMANHRGLPCKTPMGFGEISVKASHTQKGEHIAEALADFCGKQNSPLVKLCAQLTCLLQRVPQTLDDLFSFYYNLLNGWDNMKIKKCMLHREKALEAAVTGAYFGEAYPELDITPMFKSGEKNDTQHSKGNVLCVVNCNNTSPTATCGRYLLPLSVNAWSVYSEKNADKYLSWIVYLTETFYQWLQQLYNECCNYCNKPGSRCFGKVCSKTCPVKSAYASEEAATNLVGKKHTRDCKSIANCPSTRPTLCRYGFVFNSSSNLSGAKFDETKRTCNDICQALQKVLSDKEADEAPLAVLIYRTIPQFLWDIRQKFFWLNVALWSLSFLYLIHIMVIRLDLLHIKSHLHSPSSHRIAAQSLLAAGRVGKLNRVFYLQP